MNRNSPWLRIKGRDTVVLGKQCLIAIIIRLWPAGWATQGDSDPTQPLNPWEARRPQTPRFDLHVCCCVELAGELREGQTESPRKALRIQTSSAEVLSVAAAQRCLQSGVSLLYTGSHRTSGVKCRPWVTQTSPAIKSNGTIVYRRDELTCLHWFHC